VGTVANIVQSLKQSDGNIKVLVEGVERGKVLSVSEDEGYFKATVKTFQFKVEQGTQLDALTSRVTNLFEQYAKISQNVNYDTIVAAIRGDDPGKLADTVGANLQLAIEEKQELLEIFDPIDRLTRVAEMLDIEIEKLSVDRTIQGRVKRQMEKAQKEYYLNEKIKAIQKELGRGEKSEIDELKKRIETAGMTKDALDKAMAGLKRLENMPPMSADPLFHAIISTGCWRCREEEVQGNPRPQSSPKGCSSRITTARENQGTHPSNSWLCAAWSRSPRLDPLLRRASRRGQDVARHVRSPRPTGAQSSSASVARRRAR
jgi:Lon protease-like protein